MFSWFLKLLGIDEDRSNTSGNSYLDSSTKETGSSSVETVEVKAAVDETSADKTKEEPRTVQEKTVDSTETEPESLAAEFPSLKANYIKVLEEGGFKTKAAVDKASDKELLELKGIGKASLKILRG